MLRIWVCIQHYTNFEIHKYQLQSHINIHIHYIYKYTCVQ